MNLASSRSLLRVPTSNGGAQCSTHLRGPTQASTVGSSDQLAGMVVAPVVLRQRRSHLPLAKTLLSWLDYRLS